MSGRKICIDDLAILGGRRLFESPKPTSNLVRPASSRFFAYAARMGTSKLVTELEARLAEMHGVRHCVVMNSGFWSLALAIDALRLEGRSEVVLPSLTYRRMADIISWVGLVPHFCDIDARTLANSAVTVASCLNEATALIIGVHPVVGHCDIDGLTAAAAGAGVPLIFDSVESVYESHRGRRIGSFGNAELFSLGASKLINGFEGGYVTTCDDRLADRLRLMRRGQLAQAGGLALSAELTEVHAAMALAGLDDMPAQLERNRRRFEAYRRELGDIAGLRLLCPAAETEPSHKNIVVEVLDNWPYDRDRTIALLNAEMILARAYYAPPLTHRPIRYPCMIASLPNTDRAASRYISMPCGHLVSLDDIAQIVDFLRFIDNHAESITARLS